MTTYGFIAQPYIENFGHADSDDDSDSDDRKDKAE